MAEGESKVVSGNKYVAIAQGFMGSLPQARALGLQVLDVGQGMAQMRLPYAARLVADADTGVLHNGAIATLIDTCCGVAAVSHPALGQVTATLDLRLDYLRAATAGQDITVTARVLRVERSVAFVQAQAFDADGDNPVVTATAVFTAVATPAAKGA
ncbi:Phenylacetic acid degradation-related protein [Ketogulonicigenium robustum]|uniref:Phenylacetic acid degradation-related protein n=1 Tax=Ketogulonicigenium robustum TaxID=92947 RepID=A0A1W6P0Z7_9RHOB|nr:PaaI family thioesterase [Ketogulonicigenium robustum]ARO15114.1 Phenylacetic acid degradation-related protein [Ketogulonicigenium robustum]